MQPERASSGFRTKRPGAPQLRPRRVAVTALFLMPLAFVSGALSFADTLVATDPVTAQRLYPAHAKAKVRAADAVLAQSLQTAAAPIAHGGEPTELSSLPARLDRLSPNVRARLETSARSSLANTPYSPGALRQLAIASPSRAQQRSLLALSRRVSRRDVGAAAHTAELEFRDGNLRRGLETLNEALVISRALDDPIFPLLLSATRFEDFEPAFRPILERDPAWGERLAQHAVGPGGSASLFARIARHFPERSRARSIDYGAPLVDRLVSSRDFDGAFGAYEAYSPMPQDPGRLINTWLPPLDWRLIDNIDTGARQVGSRDRVVELFAKTHRSGEAARLITRLDPGQYVLGLSLGDLRGEGGRLSLETVCLAEGREWTAGTAQALIASPGAALAITVPPGCPYQSLRLAIAANGEAISVLIESARFERAATPNSTDGETL